MSKENKQEEHNEPKSLAYSSSTSLTRGGGRGLLIHHFRILVTKEVTGLYQIPCIAEASASFLDINRFAAIPF